VNPESRIQAEILSALGRLPWLRLWRQNTGVGYTRDGRRTIAYGLKGSADLSGVLYDGKRLEIEVKTQRGRQTQQQQAFESMLNSFGGVYIVARSPQDALDQLSQRGYSHDAWQRFRSRIDTDSDPTSRGRGGFREGLDVHEAEREEA
jgi:hypothetical protein